VSTHKSSDIDTSEALKAGHFLVVRSILRVLPYGVIAKAMLDSVIDACAAMQNVRTVIAQYRDNMLQEAREDKRAKILSTCTVCALSLAPMDLLGGRSSIPYLLGLLSSCGL
jgi:hypothetical protein